MLLHHVERAKEKVIDDSVQDAVTTALSLVKEVLKFVQDYVRGARSGKHCSPLGRYWDA